MNTLTNKVMWPMLLLLLSFCGCSTSPKTRLYVIEPLNSPDVGSVDSDPVVAIGPVVLPERLKRKEILTHGERYRVSTEEFDRWAEPLDENIANAVAENLSALVPGGRFLQYPSGIMGPPDFTLRIVVSEFGDSPGGNVVLNASWALIRADNEQLKYAQVRLSEPRTGSDVLSVVAAMSDLIERLSIEMSVVLEEAFSEIK